MLVLAATDLLKKRINKQKKLQIPLDALEGNWSALAFGSKSL
jgi:hypothetical protein